MATVEPQQPAWIQQAPIQIKQTASITATPNEVWDVLSNNASWPKWFPGFTRCAFTTEAPHDVGSIRELKQDQFTVSEQITLWEPAKTWGMTVTQIKPGLLNSMAETVQLTETEPGTTNIEWHIGISTKWWVAPFSSKLVKTATENLQTALRNLDTHLQSNS